LARGIPQRRAEDATAFALSTVSSQGEPDARIVLLKELRGRELVFFTNYRSKKGQDLEAHPRAHALFFWPAMERQVRIFGSVARVSDQESLTYFASRPVGSQWGAAVSDQSQPVASPANPNGVPRPPHWGGFALTAHRIEFWQGRASRLHDRIQYQHRADGTWSAQRLQP